MKAPNKWMLPALLAAVCSVSACWPKKPAPEQVDAGAQTAPSVAPTPSTVPADPDLPDELQWVVVEELGPIEGVWGDPMSNGPWVEVLRRETARAQGRTWPLPYPWRIRVRTTTHPKEWDCGLYSTHYDDDWRVGMCKGGAVEGEMRSARRITLHVLRTDAIRVGLGSGVEVTVHDPRK